MKTLYAVGIAVVITSGCAASELPTTSVSNLGTPGLEQRVTVSSSTPAVGDSILVRSVVRNTARGPITIEVGCVTRLHFTSGAFATPREPLNCEGIWRGSLARGDSLVWETMTPPMTASPGDYTLTVRHLSSPGGGVSLPLRVLPARVIAAH